MEQRKWPRNNRRLPTCLFSPPLSCGIDPPSHIDMACRRLTPPPPPAAPNSSLLRNVNRHIVQQNKRNKKKIGPITTVSSPRPLHQTPCPSTADPNLLDSFPANSPGIPQSSWLAADPLMIRFDRTILARCARTTRLAWLVPPATSLLDSNNTNRWPEASE